MAHLEEFHLIFLKYNGLRDGTLKRIYRRPKTSDSYDITYSTKAILQKATYLEPKRESGIIIITPKTPNATYHTLALSLKHHAAKCT